MIFKIISFVILQTISSCTYKSSHIGNYKSYKPIFSFKNISIGDYLQLKTDSSYVFENCGNISEGKWELNKTKDSIILFCKLFYYKNDSLNKSKSPVCNPNVPFEKFSIKNNILTTDYTDFTIMLKKVE